MIAHPLSQYEESRVGRRKHIVFCQARSTRDQVEIQLCQEREWACVGVDPCRHQQPLSSFGLLWISGPREFRESKAVPRFSPIF